jgi:hypothetical protein
MNRLGGPGPLDVAFGGLLGEMNTIWQPPGPTK